MSDDVPKANKNRYIVGQDNVQIMGMDLHNPVFFISTLLILAFVVGTIMFPAMANQALQGAKTWSINHFDWLFMLGGNVFVLFCLAIAVSPLGTIRIGGASAATEFSRASWLAMLFAAGMGIGLMFWSVAEPVAYYTAWNGTPLNMTPRTEDAKQLAMVATLYHWSLHPWAIYAVVGLSLAFFSYNKGLPLTIRSTFYPLIGEKIWGPMGHIIDTLAVLATIFGLATSLGLGAQQATSGLHFLFGIEPGLDVQLAIIIGVTTVAIFSVVRGLDGGVKLLSNINMTIALLLLIFVFLLGPTLSIVSELISASVSYITYVLPLSNWIAREDGDWFHGWTVFYWAWWVSWSPFVGMFIARISRGRTVREFITAVMLVPSVITLIWMSVFGGTALQQVESHIGQLSNGISEVSLAMFQMLDNLPLSSMSSFIAIVLILFFFVTSSDSGSLVIDSITAGGKIDAPIPQRIFWATMEGLIASALLYGGGKEALTALQAGAITTGLPFIIVLLLMCVALYRGLWQTHKNK